ncbi:MAG: hypothetical protein JXQ76_02500 [Campylobacterales bacterium]|nr:hypothetical protein [Campylobacterales bacterium]
MRLLLLLLFTTLFAFGTITSIEDIKKEYGTITKALKSYTKTSKSLDGFSAEGGEVVIYKDSSSRVKMLKITYFGEMGKMIEVYYFDDTMQLFFLYKVVENYNAHIAAKEFDESKTKITKERFYFIDTKMVQWLKGDKRIEPNSESFKDEERYIYRAFAHALLGLL